MHVTPEHATNVSRAVYGRKKLLGIAQCDAVEPGAAHVHRVVMHADEHMLTCVLAQGGREGFEPPVTATAGITDEHMKILDMTRQLNELFETWIREQPRDWLCSKRRWAKDARRP